ncbi:MAG: helix-turn-helix domain-containing protein [Gemmatimonadales bacterium]|nr:helix-turn-helix domain-containing protein [Gemmatimonadales bacterium]MDZ4390601.1 helix-turn-helix domain-containing protein [Gemmatimonadales bacterium]
MTQRRQALRPILAVADDKPLVHDAIKARLNRHFAVRNAGHRLADVDAYIARELFDVIALELSWREEGSAIPWIRRWTRHAPDLRIVVISAHAGAELSAASLEAGAVAWVSKGMPVAALSSALRKAVNGERGMVVEPLPLTFQENGKPWRRARILELLGDGWSYKEIADCLHLQPTTIEYHVRLLKRDLHLPTHTRVNWRVALEGARQVRAVTS